MDRWRELVRYLFRRYSESRRAVLISFLVIVVFLYWFGPWLTSRARVGDEIRDASGTCLEERLSRHRDARQNFNAAFHRIPARADDDVYVPFVGNGLVGLSPVGEKEIHVKASGSRVVGLKVNYYPTVSASVDGLNSKDAVVTHWKDGVVIKIQCFYQNGCVWVETLTYAHRSRPSVLVQDLKIFNPTAKRITFELQQTLSSGWEKATTRRVKSRTKTETDISVTSGSVSLKADSTITTPADKRFVLVSLASTTAPQSVDVGPGKTSRLHLVTSVAVSDASDDEKELLKKKNSQEEGTISSLDRTLNIEAGRLRNEHSQVWHNLWKTGFTIATSKATGALNGDRINSTMYYVISNVRSPIHETFEEGLGDQARQLRKENQQNLEKLLYFPDRCYSGHHTLFDGDAHWRNWVCKKVDLAAEKFPHRLADALSVPVKGYIPCPSQAPRLWTEMTSESTIARLANLWILTLEKQGCATMLRAGADGVLEAIVLAIGGLKFTNDHLEFGMEPKDLHRDLMSFRRISYGNATHLNISVHVGEDNKAQIFVALDRKDKDYYACDAGCLDPPVKLGKELSTFPVKKTEPKTAVLYITADKQHMEELKHAIHVHEIDVAPPHEHHVLALHRHGHHLGGLPPFFWVSVAFLIIVFHLFLVKLICNECKFKENNRPMANNRRFQM